MGILVRLLKHSAIDHFVQATTTRLKRPPGRVVRGTGVRHRAPCVMGQNERKNLTCTITNTIDIYKILIHSYFFFKNLIVLVIVQVGVLHTKTCTSSNASHGVNGTGPALGPGRMDPSLGPRPRARARAHWAPWTQGRDTATPRRAAATDPLLPPPTPRRRGPLLLYMECRHPFHFSMEEKKRNRLAGGRV